MYTIKAKLELKFTDGYKDSKFILAQGMSVVKLLIDCLWYLSPEECQKLIDAAQKHRDKYK